jgi:hypothetical protein
MDHGPYEWIRITDHTNGSRTIRMDHGPYEWITDHTNGSRPADAGASGERGIVATSCGSRLRRSGPGPGPSESPRSARIKGWRTPSRSLGLRTRASVQGFAMGRLRPGLLSRQLLRRSARGEEGRARIRRWSIQWRRPGRQAADH